MKGMRDDRKEASIGAGRHKKKKKTISSFGFLGTRSWREETDRSFISSEFQTFVHNTDFLMLVKCFMLLKSFLLYISNLKI